MMRVNLLSSLSRASDRHLFLAGGPRVTAFCVVLFVLSAGGIGWSLWQFHEDSARMARQMDGTQMALDRLHKEVADVDRMEGRRDDLRARLATVSEIAHRRDVPARVLGRLSRSVPNGVWLSEVQQQAESAVVHGRAETLAALKTFLEDLEAAPPALDGATLVFTRTEPTPAGEVVRFEVRLPFGPPSDSPLGSSLDPSVDPSLGLMDASESRERAGS